MLITKNHRHATPVADFGPFRALGLIRGGWGETGEPSDIRWTPSVDITETESGYRVLAEVSGVAKEDINVEFTDGVLTVSGEKKSEAEANGENSFSVERRFGAFSRCVRFHDVDGDRITASYRDGLLAVDLPKIEAAKPKRIDINVK